MIYVIEDKDFRVSLDSLSFRSHPSRPSSRRHDSVPCESARLNAYFKEGPFVENGDLWSLCLLLSRG
ncbi:unnamed protein product [Cuscuta campestris]|uniref:Uncharacterized protein n=1 Tax=Cuscuta campestris TaxID=132261 RepID=A0A484MYT5_9ASTE|nr:unnamed protein product [Cuscuta campestris]